MRHVVISTPSMEHGDVCRSKQGEETGVCGVTRVSHTSSGASKICHE